MQSDLLHTGLIGHPLVTQPSAGDAAITAFIGYFLLAFAAAAFAVYARRNGTRNRMEAQVAFWRFLLLAGVAGAGFGTFGVVHVAAPTRWSDGLRFGSLMFFIAFLALAMREVYYNSASNPGLEAGTTPQYIRRIELGFLATIALETIALAVIERTAVMGLVQGVGSLLFALYGIWFAERVETTMRGTSLETIARHIVPLLIVAGFLGMSDLAVAAGINAIFVGSAANVFVVIVATLLASSTIRLQQNVADHSVGE